MVESRCHQHRIGTPWIWSGCEDQPGYLLYYTQSLFLCTLVDLKEAWPKNNNNIKLEKLYTHKFLFNFMI